MGLRHTFLRSMNHGMFRGAARLVNRVVRPPVPIPVKTDGITLYAATLDRLAALWMRRLSKSERYEAALWIECIEPGMVIADVGANLGLYSILASHKTGAEGIVHSFEPHPGNLRMLRKGIDRNGCSNIIVHAAAVSDSTGVLDLFERPEHQGDHRIYQPSNGKARKAIRVEVTTLDDVFRDAPCLDVIKLDIQGAEPMALAGMKQVIERNPQIVMFMEFWPDGLKQAGVDPQAMLGTIRELGFTIRNIDDDHETADLVTDEQLMGVCENLRYTNLLLKR